MRHALAVAAVLFFVGSADAHAQTFLHYTFDGVGPTASGHVFSDVSDSGNNGTLVDTGTLGDTSYVSSPAGFGTAWSDPTQADDDRVVFATPFIPGAAKPWTIAFWHGMSGGASMPLFDHTTNDNTLLIRADSQNSVTLKLANQATITWPTPGIISQGGFYHFAIVAHPTGIPGVDADNDGNADHVALYVNGVLMTPSTGQNIHLYATNVTARSFADGNSGSGTFGNGHGVNDELWIIENYALDATQVGLLKNQNIVCVLGDTDGDGQSDDCDNCPLVGNLLQTDSDADGVGDMCDGVDDDVDKDGVFNALDNCPQNANGSQTDADTDGLGDACDATDNRDVDGDSTLNAADNCPFVANPDQADADDDGLGDLCDSTDGLDVDADTVTNANDNCPFVANVNQADADSDGLGDACDSTGGLDVDNDSVANVSDNCPFDANSDQSDGDNDGLGDACDPSNGVDVDGDTSPNNADNCPFVANAGQADGDGDGLGDACDSSNGLDVDGDGVTNANDNCAFQDNADQADADADGIGDACDRSNDDADGDGVLASVDNCPRSANADQADTDGDGIGDACTPAADDGCSVGRQASGLWLVLAIALAARRRKRR